MNNRILCTETIHGSCYYCYPHVLGFSISFIIFLFMQSSRINLFSPLEYIYIYCYINVYLQQGLQITAKSSIYCIHDYIYVSLVSTSIWMKYPKHLKSGQARHYEYRKPMERKPSSMCPKIKIRRLWVKRKR